MNLRMSSTKTRSPEGAPELVAHSAAPAHGSNRNFGFVFAGVFTVVAVLPLFTAHYVRWWAFAVSGAFLVAALVRPGALAPLNELWARFGLLLHRIVSPLALLLVFCLAVLPTAVLMRLSGKDPLRLRFDAGARSYWVDRVPPGRPDAQMKKQF
jgi:Saxitoxin biosynthesis operon protein SxtJ